MYLTRQHTRHRVFVAEQRAQVQLLYPHDVVTDSAVFLVMAWAVSCGGLHRIFTSAVGGASYGTSSLGRVHEAAKI